MKTVTIIRPTLAVAALVALAALTGCSSSGSSPAGDWGQVASGKPSLTIKTDGTFSGTDGCNHMSGKGTISGDTFTFGPFASTTKACEGVSPWLNLAHTAKANGNTLTVYRNGGTKIGTLDKR
jgi:heat shock protein HslJ